MDFDPLAPAFAHQLNSDTLAQLTLTALQTGKTPEAIELSLVFATRFGHFMPEAHALCAAVLARAGHLEASLAQWDKAFHRSGFNAAWLAQGLRAAWAAEASSKTAARYAERWQHLLERLFIDAPHPEFLAELTARGWQGIGSAGTHQGCLRAWLWLPASQNFHIQISGGPAFSLGPVRRATLGPHTLHVLHAPLPVTETPYTLNLTDATGRHVQGSPLICSPARSAAPRRAQRAPRSGAAGMTIIVPVYDDRQATLSCLASILASRKRNKTAFTLLVLWDHGPDASLLAALRRLASRQKIILRETPHNMGFLAGVNHALSLVPRGDVVLLNADTLVHGDWVDRMAQAVRTPDAGTVTAMGSDAELVSYPSPEHRGDVRRLRDVRRIDDACRLLPFAEALREIPVGVGFCMAVARRALDAVGGFDGLRVFSGYGEEVDLCLRVAEAGLKNYAAMNVFVAHLGGRSFGAAKRALVAQNNAAIFARYPDYDDDYMSFMRADPLAPLRERVSRALDAPAQKDAVLHIRAWADQFLPTTAADNPAAPEAVLFVRLLAGGAHALLRLRQTPPTMDMLFQLPEETDALATALQRRGIEHGVPHTDSSLIGEILQALPLELQPNADRQTSVPPSSPPETGVCLATPPRAPADWLRFCRLAAQRPHTTFFILGMQELTEELPHPANVRSLPSVDDLSPLSPHALFIPADSSEADVGVWRDWLTRRRCPHTLLRVLPEDTTEGEQPMQPTAITGEMELAGAGVRGWARGSDAVGPLWLELLADDVVVAAGRADLPEPEGCGFWMPLPSFVLEHPCTLRVRVANTSQFIGDPRSLPGKKDSDGVLQGELDSDGGLTLSGWAQDVSRPEQYLRIFARHEGAVVASAVADGRRPSPDQGDRHGFRLHLPPELADGKERLIAVEDENGRPLPGSPLQLRVMPQGPAGWLEQQKTLDAAGRALLLDLLRHLERRAPQALGEADLSFWKEAFPVPPPPSGGKYALSLHVAGGPSNAAATVWRQQKAPSCRLVAEKADMTLFLQHGERLHPHAVAHLAAALKQSGAGLVYADGETRADDGQARALCKPAWDRDAFMGKDYLGPILVSRAVMDATPLREGEGYAALRVRLALAAEQLGGIRHLPYLLSEELPLDDGDGRRAVWQQWLDERHPGARIEAQENPSLSRVRYPLPHLPRVSVIIPTRDRADLLRRCMEGLATTDYDNMEILVVDNNTADKEALALLEDIDARPNARVLRRPGIFNYAALNNDAVQEASGELLCLCNNDTEMPSPDWLKEMVSLLAAAGDEAGCVGAKLLWPNGLVQHGGVVVGTHLLAAHAGNHWTADEPGYMDRNLIVQQYSAVTAACLLTPRALFQELGGLDARRFPVNFNDVDYCLRVRAAGKKILWTPFARIVHHESASRGKDVAPMNKARAEREMRGFRQRWPFYQDPFYNPNLPLSTVVEAFEGLALPPLPRRLR